MTMVLTLLGAIAAGMVVQACLTFKQAAAFRGAVRELRTHGTVSVGAAGKRYRGGRAFVAIAVGPDGRVTKAVSLTGWTTFSRPSNLRYVQGLRLSQLRRDGPIDEIGPGQRSALQGAAQTLHAHLVKVAG